MIQQFVFIAFVAVFLTNVQFLFAEEKRQNSGRFYCPQPNKVVLHWTALPPTIQWNITTGELTGELPKFLNTVYPNCCPSLNFSYSMLRANSSEDIEISIRQDKSSHLSLYFPVFSHKEETEQYQRPYIGLYYSPGPALVIPDTGEKNTLESARIAVLSTSSWLIIVAAHGLAVIFGVTMWLLETRKNTVEFPSDFQKGAAEGTWWAFVTMTTVGYGDKAPRTYSGRVLAVSWMFLSTIIISMYTANLTADLTASHIHNEVTAQGKQVGIPLGGKTFFEHEMNLGAKFVELTFEETLKEWYLPTLDALMFYDYVEANVYQYRMSQNSTYDAFKYFTKWKVAKAYDVRFSIGISAAGNITGSFDNFLKCLQRGVVDLISVAKYDRLRSWEEIEEMKKESELNSEWTPELITISFIYVLAAALLVGGGLWQKLRKTQGNRVSNGEEC